MPEMALLDACFAPLAESGEGIPASVPQLIDGAAMPQPYRGLLVNRQDMTPNLESFHGCRLHIVVLASSRQGDDYRRQVLLIDPMDRAVEYGAIRIRLGALPPAARDEVLHGCKPFGGVLREFAIPHGSRPSAFFAIATDAVLARLFAIRPIAAAPVLYGRCNTITHADGRVIADVVEILPPDSQFHPETTP